MISFFKVTEVIKGNIVVIFTFLNKGSKKEERKYACDLYRVYSRKWKEVTQKCIYVKYLGKCAYQRWKEYSNIVLK